jgi:hypothetical protein
MMAMPRLGPTEELRRTTISRQDEEGKGKGKETATVTSAQIHHTNTATPSRVSDSDQQGL